RPASSSRARSRSALSSPSTTGVSSRSCIRWRRSHCPPSEHSEHAGRVRARACAGRLLPFVPEQVVDQVLSQTGSDLRLLGKEVVGTVMFSDLCGFNSTAEELPATDA